MRLVFQPNEDSNMDWSIMSPPATWIVEINIEAPSSTWNVSVYNSHAWHSMKPILPSWVFSHKVSCVCFNKGRIWVRLSNRANDAGWQAESSGAMKPSIQMWIPETELGKTAAKSTEWPFPVLSHGPEVNFSAHGTYLLSTSAIYKTLS